MDSDTELVNAVKGLRKRFGKDKLQSHLKKINMIESVNVIGQLDHDDYGRLANVPNEVNSVTSLPFLHGKLSDRGMNTVPCRLLFDSGSSISLIS